jgi:hypothetical protein
MQHAPRNHDDHRPRALGRCPLLVGPRPPRRRAVHGGVGRLDRQRRAAVDRLGAALRARRPAVGRHRLRALQRWPPAHRRARGGPPRPAPHLPGRAAAVHRGLAGVRARRLGRPPGRRPRRPGHRRRDAQPGGDGDHHHHLPGRGSRPRVQHLGGGRQRRRRGRRGARRRADDVAELALGVPRQRAGRAARRRTDTAARPGGRAVRTPPRARSARRGHGRRRPGAAGLRALGHG